MRKRALSFALVCGLIVGAIGLSQWVGVASGPAPAETPETARFGVNVLGSIAPYNVAQLNIGWYMNWSYAASPPQPNGVAFAQTIRLREDPLDPSNDHWPPNWDTVAAAIAANPGALWLIGNEPDHRGQDNCLATEYAERYHACYTFIKARDATARVTPGGLAQVTPLRLHWLNDVLQAYQSAYGTALPADAWQVHVQILCETCAWGATYPPGLQAYQMTEGTYYSSQDAASVSIFITMIRAFRTWMRDNGYRDKPLIISEYGVLQPSGCGYLGGGNVAVGNQMVKDFMTGTFDYCLQTTDGAIGYPADSGRLVQQWAWYSLNARMSAPDCSYLNSANGSLYDWQNATLLTEFGLLFQQYTSALLPPPTGVAMLVARTTPQRYQPAGDAAWSTALTLGLRDTGSGATNTYPVVTDAYGVFTTTLATGIYDIGVKGGHTLESTRRNVVLAQGAQQVDLGVLLEGDANDDNEVGILDYSLLYNAFDSSQAPADFNQDGLVDVLDYSLLYANFDRVGPIYLNTLPFSGWLHQDALRLSVNGGNLVWSGVLPVTIKILAGSAEVDACQLRLRFDPSLVRVVDDRNATALTVTPGTQLTQIIRNTVDHEQGEVYFVAGAALSAPPATGEIVVARFKLSARAPIERTTTLAFSQTTIGRAGMPYKIDQENGAVQILIGQRRALPLVFKQRPITIDNFTR